MTITLASFSSGTTGGNGALTLPTTVPTGVVAGNLLVLFVAIAGTNATTPVITVPTGYTQITAGTSGSPASGYNVAVGIYYKVATSSESAFTINATNVGGRMVYGLHRYTGVDITTPFVSGEVATSFGTGSGNAAVHTAPSITTAASREIITFGADVQGSTWTFPAGYTVAQTSTTGNTNITTAYSTTALAAGTIAPGSITSSASSAVWAVGTLALNPGAATAPTVATTVTSDVALIDATGSTAGGGVLSYTISPTTGTTQVVTGKFLVPRGTTDTTYTVTATESGSGLSGTKTAVSPAKAPSVPINTAIPKSPVGGGSSGNTWTS